MAQEYFTTRRILQGILDENSLNKNKKTPSLQEKAFAGCYIYPGGLLLYWLNRVSNIVHMPHLI